MGLVFSMGKRVNYGIFLLALVPLIFGGCSAEKTNLISVTYHNTTARYNAYFYAKERIKEIETGIANQHQNDFDHILKIFPPLDTTHATTYQIQIEDVVKKASLAIQNHKNSKWVDDSYNLLGMARLYSHEHETAIVTFKHVNTTSNDRDARHRALVNLMRTFIEYGEMNNAIAVSDFLKKEKLNKRNLKQLYLVRAYYYQKQADYDNLVQNLVLASPLLTKKDGKAKINFIIGQVYQQLGFDAEAYRNYKRCLASNPPYELSFYAKLNMAQVTELSRSSDVKRVRKYFRKLLADAKNREFRDKIYYEMAQFEMKQNDIDGAIPFYNESIRASIGNNRQKGLSYLRLGEIYYDTLRNYELAQKYYDSTILVMPTTYEDYEAVKSRQEVLAEFVKQLNVIALNDSLINLASMDSTRLVAYLTEQVEDRKAAEEEKKKNQQRQQRRRSPSAFDSGFGDNTGILTSSLNWYFSNPSAISLGQSEFRKKWGNRSLEDDWRRANKESNISLSNNTNNTTTASNTESTDSNEAGDNANAIQTEVKQMLAKIPFSNEAKEKALVEITDAYYSLGNIYHFNLFEDHNSINSFETLLDRFPSSEYEPEVLYLLHLMYKEMEHIKQETYKKRLIADHPKTTYAKLLINPNYTEESSKELDQLKKVYKSAYALYEQESFPEARALIRQALITYNDTEFFANLRLLDILIVGKSESKERYISELDKFITEYPDHGTTAFAKNLLATAKDFEDNLFKSEATDFALGFEQLHYFLLVYDSNSGIATTVSDDIKRFNELHFKESAIDVDNIVFDSGKSMVLVSSFENRSTALEYFDYFKAESSLLGVDSSNSLQNFVITKDNFDILYQTKDLESYRSFFDRNY